MVDAIELDDYVSFGEKRKFHAHENNTGQKGTKTHEQ